ncbi:MAG: RNB domain-containing ribonuclease [Sulfuritalea sp.]|nr:RNB domain-containing ribonuclease [Polynucleobacter sp.]MCF8187456.1 RNB domain-containing ribonuclease [Sulfuritalea sp.]
MNLFFEESGDFKAGTVLTQQGEAFQVETLTGKRSKVRARDVLLQFDTPSPGELISRATSLSHQMDVSFLWEVAGEQEFSFADLGQEYFGHAPSPEESAGLLLTLASAPVYFHKKGKGRYKAAPAEILKAALAGVEKKKQQALLQAKQVEELKAGQLPASMASLVNQLLFKPDKNSIEYKALDTAAQELQTTPARLMLSVGAISSARELHMNRFLSACFPRGTGFPEIAIPAKPQLVSADVQAFSIDDVTTTEIDDAFSVRVLDDGKIRVGIHIAAPGMGIEPGDAIDKLARERMSTVYMPGDKITMLPDELVSEFTLAEGDARPALSLYATIDTADWSVIATETVAEAVPVAANLRHNDLDELVTEENLAASLGEYPHKKEIQLLWQWAQTLERGRMQKRESFGLRPEQNNRVDFNFYVEDEIVTINRRKRGAPLDKIVAELMIYANSSWGLLLHEHGVPGIYRTQGSGNGWAARMQVRMLTHAAPHQGLGVDQYAWSTSPLRRYTDLVNQWQILACLKHGVTAPLVAPFKARDADLFAIVSAFDAAYAAYADFQNIMEHYWCLRWLSQHEARKVQAVQIKDDLLKLVDIPLILPMVGVKHPRGTQLTIELISWDEVDLSVQARLLEVSQAALAVDEDSDFDDGDSTDESEQVVEQVLSEEADANTLTVSADPIIQSNSDSSTSAL